MSKPNDIHTLERALEMESALLKHTKIATLRRRDPELFTHFIEAISGIVTPEQLQPDYPYYGLMVSQGGQLLEFGVVFLLADYTLLDWRYGSAALQMTTFPLRLASSIRLTTHFQSPEDGAPLDYSAPYRATLEIIGQSGPGMNYEREGTPDSVESLIEFGKSIARIHSELINAVQRQ